MYIIYNIYTYMVPLVPIIEPVGSYNCIVHERKINNPAPIRV